MLPEGLKTGVVAEITDPFGHPADPLISETTPTGCPIMVVPAVTTPPGHPSGVVSAVNEAPVRSMILGISGLRRFA